MVKAQNRLYACSMKCIAHLVSKGHTAKTAEEMVLVTLKDAESYLKAGMIDETIASLQMIHMDKSVQRAATGLIKQMTR